MSHVLKIINSNKEIMRQCKSFWHVKQAVTKLLQEAELTATDIQIRDQWGKAVLMDPSIKTYGNKNIDILKKHPEVEKFSKWRFVQEDEVISDSEEENLKPISPVVISSSSSSSSQTVLGEFLAPFIEEECESAHVLSKLTSLMKETWKLEGVTPKLFGSRKLGVHFKGSDIDVYCDAPSYDDHQTLFDVIEDHLKTTNEVSDLEVVRAARVPVFNFVLLNYQVDLIVVTGEESPQNAAKRITSGISEKIIESPSYSRSFQEVLTFMRIFAKRRAISGAGFGYLSGVAWTLLLFHICSVQRSTNSYEMMKNTFRHYSEFDFSQAIVTDHRDQNDLSYETGCAMRVIVPDGKSFATKLYF
jgi:hypothetical protein